MCAESDSSKELLFALSPNPWFSHQRRNQLIERSCLASCSSSFVSLRFTLFQSHLTILFLYRLHCWRLRTPRDGQSAAFLSDGVYAVYTRRSAASTVAAHLLSAVRSVGAEVRPLADCSMHCFSIDQHGCAGAVSFRASCQPARP